MCILQVEELELRQLLNGARFSMQPTASRSAAVGTFGVDRSGIGHAGPVGQGRHGEGGVEVGPSRGLDPDGGRLVADGPRGSDSGGPLADRAETREVGPTRSCDDPPSGVAEGVRDSRAASSDSRSDAPRADGDDLREPWDACGLGGSRPEHHARSAGFSALTRPRRPGRGGRRPRRGAGPSSCKASSRVLSPAGRAGIGDERPGGRGGWGRAVGSFGGPDPGRPRRDGAGASGAPRIHGGAGARAPPAARGGPPHGHCRQRRESRGDADSLAH